ncbi:MAG TPA: FHA domain-containing protein [Acidobacteriota bacterium]|nr:FHA domain-containing protein [Acidobacteriota bacterium]
MSLAKLILAKPFEAQKHFLINKNPFVIGRSQDCSLILQARGISKHHSSILFDEEQYRIEDLQSKNGTLVNGSPIEQITLKDHDVITIGALDLTFRRMREEEFSLDLERKLVKFRSALELTRTMGTHRILDPVLDEIMSAFMRLTQAERGFLLVEEEDQLKMMRSVNISSRQLHEQGFNLSWSAVQKAIREKLPVAISNAMDDTYFGDQSSVRNLELKTLVCIPIVLRDRVIGILYADSNRKELEFAQLDIEVLEYLAGNAAIAIENAKINEEIWQLMEKTTHVLGKVEEKAGLDQPLQVSVREALDSLSSLKRRRSRPEKH